MSPLARRTRAILAFAVLVAALPAWQGVAAAQVDATGATIDGVAGTSGPPGSVIDARVEAAVDGTTWRRTRVEFSAPGSRQSTCVDTGDRGPGSSGVADLRVTAPGAPADYDVTFNRSRPPTARGRPAVP